MARTIGNANEFWRLRMTKVDASDALDFEWHDDILWREPRVELPDEYDIHLVEAVSVTEPELIVRIAAFGSSDEASDFVAEAEDDLADMTASQFETAYFPQPAE